MADHEGTSVVAPDLDAVDGEDGGGWGARLVAKLDLSLGAITDEQRATTAELRKLRQQARQLPALVKVSSAFTYSTGAHATIVQQGGSGVGVVIGGPPIGSQWSVRQIVVGGTTLGATPAGKAWFLVTAGRPVALSLTDVVDMAGTIPDVAFYGADEFYLAPNEKLYMVVTGGTNAVTYVASVSYQQSLFVPRSTTELV